MESNLCLSGAGCMSTLMGATWVSECELIMNKLGIQLALRFLWYSKTTMWWKCLVLALQAHPTTSNRNRPEELQQKQEAAQSNNMQDTVIAPSKSSSTKRQSVKQENLNLNCLSRNRDKNYATDAIPWSSLPANLLKPGRVITFCQCYLLIFLQLKILL